MKIYDKPRSPFWILLWTGFALSVVSAVVDHDADYVLGTGLSAVFSAMDIALSLWMAVALVKRCRWAKFNSTFLRSWLKRYA